MGEKYEALHRRKYVTTQDITISAGTELVPSPIRVSHFVPYASAILGHGKDAHSEWSMDIEDALALGIIEEAQEVEQDGEAA